MENTKISSILVPVDFSEASKNTVVTAIAMAKRYNAKLHLLNVIETSSIYMAATSDLNHIMTISRSLLEEMENSIKRNTGIDCSYHSIPGHVPDSICTFATQNSASIIVMGSHGTSGMRELFIGSNTYDVIKKAPCPILTIPPIGIWVNFKKVLFPVRPVENALDKYDFIRNIIRKNNAELIVLGFKNTNDTADLELIDSYIDKLKLKLKEDEISSAIHYYTGDDFITAFWQFQDRLATDLIVITANIDNSFKDYFIGPFTQQIINHAKVPVLSIKPEYGKNEPNPDYTQMAEWAAKYGSNDPFSPAYR